MTDITLTYCVLAHESTARVERLVDKLLEEDTSGQVIVHFDEKSGEKPYRWLFKRYKQEERCHILQNRVRCGWGQWSLVEATLRMLSYAQATRKTDYYYLLSEYCYPTQPLSALKIFLQENKGTNFIECEDSSWIKGGIREDRYLYRHFLDKRKYPRLHRWMYKCQKWLGLKRKVPESLTISFGSQWWCLTNESVEYVTSVVTRYRGFFRWVWIPDECFFSTLLFSHKKSFLSITYVNFDSLGLPKEKKLENISNVELKYFFLRKVL